MTDIVSVYAVFAGEQEACRIAATVVEERLAACANVLGACHSIYRWQGKVEAAAEAAVLFKARADKAEALIARIAALHSYEVPAAVAWPIVAALPAYARWVAEEG
jgi:periplasmic divalent cation tolerance protein